ncbi:MAG: tRNA preQ1(34) S-adenosylmethionine ribosyltransferase-isomerase QueA [Sulfurospirillaceae bacterium]
MPEYLIAKFPSNPKDHSKLLVYDRKKDFITHTKFYNIESFLPKDLAIILNDTKVIKARIFGQKSSGGKIELLLNSPLQDSRFSAYIKGRVKKDSTIFFQKGLCAKVEELKDDGLRVVSFFLDENRVKIDKLYSLLEEIGHTPLPPYINRSDNEEDIVNYQTLFASKEGAVAAPTASLHFTKELLDSIKSKFQTSFITLHVGAGTFKPVEANNINDHVMHFERFEISQTSKDIISSNKPILAVGTTATRAVEHYTRTGKMQGSSNLFLHPQNPPQRVSHLLTNFHLPCSTLIMLVASFIGVEKTLEIYHEAISKEYRFYSYGDAMLIL